MIISLKVLLGRTLPPALLALFVWSNEAQFVDHMEYATSWQALGLLLPVLWLASIGPDGLSQDGGFLMGLMGYQPDESDPNRRRRKMRNTASVVGLGWLTFGIVFAFITQAIAGTEATSMWARLCYCLMNVGVVAGLGVYVLLAISAANATTPPPPGASSVSSLSGSSSGNSSSNPSSTSSTSGSSQ